MTRQGALAEEVAGGQYRDHRFFSYAREHRELDRALLDVPDVVAPLALREDDFAPWVLNDLSGRTRRFEILRRIEPATGLRLDRSRFLSHAPTMIILLSGPNFTVAWRAAPDEVAACPS